MDDCESSYSGWMTSAQAAQELGRTIRRVQQLYRAGRLRGVMVGTPGRLMPIRRENHMINGKVVTMQCRGSSELRLDPESVFERVRWMDRCSRDLGANRIARSARKQEFFASRVKQFRTGWERDYQCHDFDDQYENG